MTTSGRQSADEILEDTFLEARAKLLEIAAMFDRVDRASQTRAPQSQASQSQASPSSDPLNERSIANRKKLAAGMKICLSADPDRAAQLQQLFSRSYSDSWRQEMGL